MPSKVDDSYYKLNDNKRKIVEKNYGLIIKIATEFANLNNKIELDDIIQICSIGLIKALKHYDPSKGILSSYAKRWMWNEYNRYTQKIPEELYLEDIKVEQSGDILNYEDLITDNKNIEKEIIDNLHVRNSNKYLLEILKHNLPEKNINIIEDYLLGETQSDIARRYKVSRQRIGQIIIQFRNEYGQLINRDKIIS